jgi:ATP-dependent Zn protease
MKIITDVDFDQLARDLPGLSGAELANVLNEAALYALRRGGNPQEGVLTDDVYAAVDRILQGVKRSGLNKDLPMLRRLACHEIGHAIVASVLRKETGNIEQVERVSIEARGDEWTRTVFLRGDDETYTIATRTRMLERLQVLLGGRAAEEVVYGQPSTHSVTDIADATILARRFITTYALGDELNIPTFHDRPSQQMGSVYNQWKKFSGQVEGVDVGNNDPSSANRMGPSNGEMLRAHTAADNLVRAAYAANVDLLQQHKAALLKSTDLVLDKEQILGEELQAVIDTHPANTPVDASEEEKFASVAAIA